VFLKSTKKVNKEDEFVERSNNSFSLYTSLHVVLDYCNSHPFLVSCCEKRKTYLHICFTYVVLWHSSAYVMFYRFSTDEYANIIKYIS